ncbi:MAG: hypothetical protein PHI05_00320 [Bacilli bacterium]|nr:hypothetical protein [Bacilli bacterium]MDD4547184.1 hypothetical protein [Bacilli bacterium]
MSSRMEKYYKTNSNIKRRSVKNEELYRTIYDDGEYSNIEGIANIEKKNEIDLTQIRELLKSVETNGRETSKPVVTPKTETKDTSIALMDEEHKSYDIKDVLNKAKDERTDKSSEYHQLSNTQFNILKKIKIDEPLSEEEDQGLKELIHTITNTSMLNKLEDRELSLNLLSSLKDSENTLINEKSYIDNMIDDEEQKEEVKSKVDEIDKSFFTSSLGFCDEDFEDLKDIKKTLRKNTFFIKSLTFLLVAIIIGVIIYVVYNIL